MPAIGVVRLKLEVSEAAEAAIVRQRGRGQIARANRWWELTDAGPVFSFPEGIR